MCDDDISGDIIRGLELSGYSNQVWIGLQGDHITDQTHGQYMCRSAISPILLVTSTVFPGIGDALPNSAFGRVQQYRHRENRPGFPRAIICNILTYDALRLITPFPIGIMTS